MENKDYDEVPYDPERSFFGPIYLPLTTEQCEELFPESKGQWKPMKADLIDMTELMKNGPYIITSEMAEKGKFRFSVPFED